MSYLKRFVAWGTCLICCEVITISYADERSIFTRSEFLQIVSLKKDSILPHVNAKIDEKIKKMNIDNDMGCFLKLDGLLSSIEYAKIILKQTRENTDKRQLGVISPALPEQLFLYSPLSNSEDIKERELLLLEEQRKSNREPNMINGLNRFLISASGFTSVFIKNTYTSSEIKKIIIPWIKYCHPECFSVIIW